MLDDICLEIGNSDDERSSSQIVSRDYVEEKEIVITLCLEHSNWIENDFAKLKEVINDTPEPESGQYVPELSRFSLKNGIVYIFLTKEYFETHRLQTLCQFLCNISESKECRFIIKKQKGLEIVYNANVADFETTKIEKNIDRFQTFLDGLLLNKELLPIKEEDFTVTETIYHQNGLVIWNIDSDCTENDLQLDYASNIISTWIHKIKDINGVSVSYSTNPLYMAMPYPLNILGIPILLLKEMPTYQELWKDIDNRYYSPKGKVLGYFSKVSDPREQIKIEGPHIVLGPEEIQEAASKSKIDFKILLAKVLVHEIAHALMDNNDGDLNTSIEAKAMEESLANAITLKCFEKFRKEDLSEVRHFVDNWQPSIYRFGIWQGRIDADWVLWRGSRKQCTKALKEWFNNCFEAGCIRENIDRYTNVMYLDALKI